MNFAKKVMLKHLIRDYTNVESRMLLNQGAKADESLSYVGSALVHQISLVGQEFKARGLSDLTRQLLERTNEIYADYQLLVNELAAIKHEVIRRMWHNATNGYFAQLLIGGLMSNHNAQKEAVRNLYKLLGRIPGKKQWRHPEEREGVDSLANLLLAKELHRHKDLDLPSTLEYAMDNRFAYIYGAYECDFKDEIDKFARRPFERPFDPEWIGQVDLRDDKIQRQKQVIRLREFAVEQHKPVDREIILDAASMLTNDDLLTLQDKDLRADLIKRVADTLGISNQWVRRRLMSGAVLGKVKQILEPDTPRQRFKVILTDDEEK